MLSEFARKRILAKSMVTLGLVTGLSLTTFGQAYAAWDAVVKGPDVFGNTTVAAIEESDFSDSTLVVQCDQKDNLNIALIEPGTASQLDNLTAASVPATFFIKIDDGPVGKFSAELTRWNNKYIGIVARGKTPALINAVLAIGKGKEAVSVGIDVRGSRNSARFGVYGSTAAMDKVINGCKLDDADQ